MLKRLQPFAIGCLVAMHVCACATSGATTPQDVSGRMRGAEERLAPILMTALVTALALLPVVFSGKAAGHEIEHPMAVVILGGLATSTALNLLLLPALYAKYGRPVTTSPSM